MLNETGVGISMLPNCVIVKWCNVQLYLCIYISTDTYIRPSILHMDLPSQLEIKTPSVRGGRVNEEENPLH
jgi:hypothetical protein